MASTYPPTYSGWEQAHRAQTSGRPYYERGMCVMQQEARQSLLFFLDFARKSRQEIQSRP